LPGVSTRWNDIEQLPFHSKEEDKRSAITRENPEELLSSLSDKGIIAMG